MRTSMFFLLSTFVALWLCSPLYAGQPSFTVAIRAENPTVKRGVEAVIELQLTNISYQNVDCTTVHVKGLDRRYRYEIKNNNGDQVQKLQRKHPDVGESGSFHPCTLAPGKSTNWVEERIGATYDLSQPGTYNVQVWRKGTEGNEIRSNTLTITVTP